MKKLLITFVVLMVVGLAIVAGLTAYLYQQRDEGNLPTAKPSSQQEPDQSEIDKKLQSMSLRDKVANLFMFHTPGTNQQQLGRFVSTYHPGGFIMMGDNIPARMSQLSDLTNVLRGDDGDFPRLVATDEEGGVVKRLGSDTYPAAKVLKNKPVADTAQAFTKRSQLVHSAGINLNFGIIADTTADPNSFIYNRVLGTTPQASADRVAAAVKASHDYTLTTLKHFPGHGESEADSHHTIPVTDVSYDYWLHHDAVPFAAGIKAGVDAVMVGHLRYSDVDSAPASLSAKWHEILRDKLHFDGCIVTDDMVMLQDSGEVRYRDPVHNAVTALQAGNDLLLYVLNNDDSKPSQIDPNSLIDGVLAAVKDGNLNEATINAAVRHVLTLQQRAGQLFES